MEPRPITCQACLRAANPQRPFHCVQCARTRLYETRLHHVQALLTKEALVREIDHAIGCSKGSADDQADPVKDDGLARTWALASLRARAHELRDAASAATTACTQVAATMEELRLQIAERRKTVRQRDEALVRRKNEVSARGLRDFNPIPGAARKLETDWTRLYSVIAEDRVLLCTEAANLSGLEMRRSTRESRAKDTYYLGDVPIIDLRDLNAAAPRLITVSLSRIAHLIHLTSHYLSLQLPAEISLPAPGRPHTLIFTPASSYKDPSLPAGHRRAANATKSSRQRSLYLDKPLVQLVADDQVSYALFVEAVTLLAWDIAWLAKAQGIDLGVKHWEELCAMGRNLWLLFGPQSRERRLSKALSPTRANSYDATASPVSAAAMARTPSGGGGGGRPSPATTALAPGRMSHNSAFAFLPSAAGQGGAIEAFRAWQFASPIRLIERVKASLANERMGAEWEVLEKEEWAGHSSMPAEVAADSGSSTPSTSTAKRLDTAAAAGAGATGGSLGAALGTARVRGLLFGKVPSTADATGAPT